MENEKETDKSDKPENPLATGDNCQSEQITSTKEDASVEVQPQTPQSSSEPKRRVSNLTTSLRNLVRGRSKSRNKDDEKEKEGILSDDPEYYMPEKEENEARSSFSKLFHNVSSSLQRGRSSMSSSDIREDEGESVKTGFRIFKRSSSKTELDSSECTSLEVNKGGTLGRLFGKRSPSKPDLGSDVQEMNKGGTLGRLFRRRSISRTDVMPDECCSAEGKSSIGRRIGSSIMGAFGKKDIAKAQEAP